MPSGSICLLENTRFYKHEEKNEASFAKKLAGSCAVVYLPGNASCRLEALQVMRLVFELGCTLCALVLHCG